MAAAKRKVKEQAERVGRIISAARQTAESEGWSAVTVRRLADMIEYSQPVLYSHFANRDAIVAGVAIEGFKEITVALKRARRHDAPSRAAIQRVGRAYLDFASKNPALYEAMFTMRTSLHFAQADTKTELREAFAALAAVFPPSR
ncbi:MAG: TetR/AcrR family transcriptional regulator, partial [Acetobacteraceae bacterium]|nr:TetR/AcrR family transcriptional regulator [Acetobacteraceae bacterium]